MTITEPMEAKGLGWCVCGCPELPGHHRADGPCFAPSEPMEAKRCPSDERAHDFDPSCNCGPCLQPPIPHRMERPPMTDQPVMSETEFVRNATVSYGRSSVEVIHRRGCGAVKNMKEPLPWNWAEGRDPSEWVGLSWFKPCARCCPDLLVGSSHE